MTYVTSVVNGKGGTGKTSIACNVAALAATAGYRTLVVDLDPQHNTRNDLGYPLVEGDPTPGQLLMGALQGFAEPPVWRGVRPGLDVIAGGEELEDWSVIATQQRQRRRGQPEAALARLLKPLLQAYDLVLIDCPPGIRELQLLALVAARFTLIPTKPDEGSLDGLIRVARLFSEAHPHNPNLELLGVVLFGIDSRASRFRADIRGQIEMEVGEPGTVLNATIRHVLIPASEGRARHQLAHEYEHAPGAAVTGGARPGASASGLATDYEELTTELLGRMRDLASMSAREGVPA